MNSTLITLISLGIVGVFTLVFYLLNKFFKSKYGSKSDSTIDEVQDAVDLTILITKFIMSITDIPHEDKIDQIISYVVSAFKYVDELQNINTEDFDTYFDLVKSKTATLCNEAGIEVDESLLDLIGSIINSVLGGK
jgi:hypothetical protein